MKYETINIFIEGAMCGPIWQPGFDNCGVPVSAILPRPAKGQRLETLARRYLLDRGGDFQQARFTEDTCIVIVRRTAQGRMIRLHSRDIPIQRIAPELVAMGTDSADYG